MKMTCLAKNDDSILLILLEGFYVNDSGFEAEISY